MQVGDLVKVIPTVFEQKIAGLAIIVKLDEPTVRQPHQIATVRFTNGFEDKFVTTVLRGLK